MNSRELKELDNTASDLSALDVAELRRSVEGNFGEFGKVVASAHFRSVVQPSEDRTGANDVEGR